jgi:cardiolipin synthase
MQRAKESIYLEMYIFEATTLDHDFAGVLKEKAQTGVRVRVILDALGSSSLAKHATEELRSAGVEVLFYRFWFHRTHRKLLIVDENIAYIGGANIAPRFRQWNDLVVKVRGRVAKSVTRSFARVYRTCGGKDPYLLAMEEHRPLARAKNWFVEHGIGGSSYTLRSHYLKHIDAAERSIVIITPYFLPRHWLIAAIGRAVQRGVSVDVLIPKETDFKTVTRLNHYYAMIIERLGASAYLMDTMNHAKAMLVDDHIGVVGSQNIDPLSFNRNVEAGYFFTTPSVIDKLREAINTWREDAQPYESYRAGRRWYDGVVAWLLRPLARVL